jgi:hypothetical protein
MTDGQALHWPVGERYARARLRVRLAVRTAPAPWGCFAIVEFTGPLAARGRRLEVSPSVCAADAANCRTGRRSGCGHGPCSPDPSGSPRPTATDPLPPAPRRSMPERGRAGGTAVAQEEPQPAPARRPDPREPAPWLPAPPVNSRRPPSGAGVRDRRASKPSVTGTARRRRRRGPGVPRGSVGPSGSPQRRLLCGPRGPGAAATRFRLRAGAGRDPPRRDRLGRRCARPSGRSGGRR